MKTIVRGELDQIIAAYTASPSQEAALRAMQELQFDSNRGKAVFLKMYDVDAVEKYLQFIGTLSAHLDTASTLSLISLLHETFVVVIRNNTGIGFIPLLSHKIVSDNLALLNDYITPIHLFLMNQDVAVMIHAIEPLLLWMRVLNVVYAQLCDERVSTGVVIDAIVGGGSYYYDDGLASENAQKMLTVMSAIAVYAITVINLSNNIHVYQENAEACAAVKKLWMSSDALSLFEHIKNNDFFALLGKNLFSIIGAKDTLKEIIKEYPNSKDQLLAYVLKCVNDEPETTKKIALLKTALDPQTDLGCVFWCQRHWISKPSEAKGTLLILRQQLEFVDPSEKVVHHTSKASTSKSPASFWKKRPASVADKPAVTETKQGIEMQTFTS